MIEMKGLRAAYNGKDVLKGIDLNVEEGTFMGLLGPNGSGKTTLLRCITGNLQPTGGNIDILGKAPGDWNRKELARKLAHVPQDTQPGFDYLVSEVVGMGRYPHMGRFQFSDPEGDMIVDRSLEWTELEGMKSKRISQLSGGERQRVFIARAFAQNTEILVLDEPTKNLDIRHSMDIMDLIRKRNKIQGITVLSVLHDLDLAAKYCDEIALLKNGKIVVVGGVDEVLTERSIENVFDIKVKVHGGKGFHIEVTG